jgi:hypothetical protein
LIGFIGLLGLKVVRDLRPFAHNFAAGHFIEYHNHAKLAIDISPLASVATATILRNEHDGRKPGVLADRNICRNSAIGIGKGADNRSLDRLRSNR